MKPFLRRSKDLKAVKKLQDRYLPDADWPAGERVAYWILYQECTDGTYAKVGFCSACIDEDNPKVAHLTASGVAPYVRGGHLQQKMIRARILWAKREGCKVVKTYAATDNYPSIINLLQQGFRFKDTDKSFHNFELDLSKRVSHNRRAYG